MPNLANSNRPLGKAKLDVPLFVYTLVYNVYRIAGASALLILGRWAMREPWYAG